MVVPEERPKIGVAIKTKLLECTYLTDMLDTLNSGLYTGQSIFVGLPRNRNNKISVPDHINMVVILPGRGGQGDDGLGHIQERVEIYSYGNNHGNCRRIWGAIDVFLGPANAQGVRQSTSFTRDGCQVNWSAKEAAPLELTDPDLADWPYMMCPYIFSYNGFIRV